MYPRLRDLRENTDLTQTDYLLGLTNRKKR